MSKNQIKLDTKQQKEMYEKFKYLSDKHGKWEVWSNFITLSACCLCVSDRNQHEKEYMTVSKKYNRDELLLFSQMLALTVDAFEANPDQDFLGDLFMRFDLSDTWKGQFFTPYNVSKAMASVIIGNLDEQMEKKPWISVCDPACGAGALLIAFAQECLRQNVDYQASVLFVAQDIDRTAALMCFVQLSLLGCPGYVIVGDSITNPTIGRNTLLPLIQPNQEVWYTPMMCTDIWQSRVVTEKLRRIVLGQNEQKTST